MHYMWNTCKTYLHSSFQGICTNYELCLLMYQHNYLYSIIFFSIVSLSFAIPNLPRSHKDALDASFQWQPTIANKLCSKNKEKTKHKEISQQNNKIHALLFKRKKWNHNLKPHSPSANELFLVNPLVNCRFHFVSVKVENYLQRRPIKWRKK